MKTDVRPPRITTQAGNGGSPAFVAVGRFASIALSLLTIPVIAQVLGPSGRGVSATMVATVTLVSVAIGLGVPLALRRRVAEGESIVAVTAAGRLFALLTTPAALLLGFVLDVTLFHGESLDARVAFYVAMATIPLNISWAQDVSVLVVERKFTRMAILGVSQSAIALVVIVALWLTSTLTVAGVVYASVAGNVLTFLLGLIWVRSGIGGRALMTRIAKEGTTLVGAQLADVGMRRLDQVIALPLLGAGGAGLYAIAAAIASLAMPVAHAISSALYKDMTGESAVTPQRGADVMRAGFALGVIAFPFIGVGTYFGVPLLFGEEFRGAIAPALVATLSTPFVIGGYCGTIWMTAQQRGATLTRIQLVALLFMLIAFVGLGWVWSVTGAAAGTTLAAILTYALIAANVSGFKQPIIPHSRDFRLALRSFLRG